MQKKHHQKGEQNGSGIDRKSTGGNFEFAAEVSAVAVTASVQAQASTTGATGSANLTADAGEQTKTAYRKGMLVFVMGKGGFMYQAALAGQKYTYRPVK